TLEIGFGDGRALLANAKAHPHINFIGIEVYKAGIAKLLAGINAQQLSNIRIYCADAVEVLTNCIPAQSLQQIQLFFPDPWPKVRHHKRRIVRPEFVRLLAEKLQIGGSFHMATDWEEYAAHMLAVMEADPNWVNLAGVGQFISRPDTRPLTKYEQRGQRLGYKTWDLLFTLRHLDLGCERDQAKACFCPASATRVEQQECITNA
ncbi:MAG TPA: tRNA (guanosine(46)-N7)-methyltransferase TrmB, partial [Gammaproteobacteria bacterium]|nr:tRNA (guanosine(46)-N7)-methyltransferase TrmB [Gammaproteobacteria bacterium]